jgi:hypothetical protein
VGVDSKHGQFYMATAHPYLDDWYTPEEVLSDEEFEKDLLEKLDAKSPVETKV